MPRRPVRLGIALCAVTLAAGLCASPARADEGMWTLDNLPLQQLKERYGFSPNAQWVEHIQKACVHFGGGSGAFVSPDGLVLTNHHVAMGQLQKLSSAEHNYLRDGFFARTAAEEVRCPDLELRVLWSMEEVTARVVAAVDAKASAPEQSAQRKAAIASIEQESLAQTKLRSDVVELYQGGEYWLYRYKTYKDVRLVCAPEEQAAFYGGDSDNFAYPRHDLDFAFFRIYDQGAPLHPEHWIKWSASGVSAGDLVFVSGNPGRTNRRRTVAQLEYERDYELPVRIKLQEQRLAVCRSYAALGAEQARQARDRVRSLENNLKRQRGFLQLLRDPQLIAQKRAAEEALRARVAKDPTLAAQCAGAWDRVAQTEAELAKRSREQLDRDLLRVSRLVDLASGIVRYTAESEKPNGERLKEYREGNLDSQRFQLLSPAPVFPDLEERLLASQLEICRADLGQSDPFVQAALQGKAPADVAHAVLSGTALASVDERKRLLSGGRAAVDASGDPLIQWARRIDPPYRELRQWMEDRIESVIALEGGRIARASFSLDGKSVYPDATGTLRLSFGKVAGYTQLSTDVPWRTTFFGLFDRAASFEGRAPFDLPPRVTQSRDQLDLATPLDFVCTTDIIGGNSGSPVLDRNGEYVGLVFDGNIQSFAWDYVYTDEQARCVAVDGRGLMQALRHIYGMDALAGELSGRPQ